MVPHMFFYCFLIIATEYHPSDGGSVLGNGGGGEFQPEFSEALENVTVPLGRDATFTCVVKGLGGYRVGWVRADSKAIQAIHTHVITHNPRVSVSHSDHSTWHLHIKGVKEEDRGAFMCQVNTDPMISQISYLEVVIPPDFIPEETSGDVMAPEGSSVKLICNARGHPTPNIVWKRENGQNITLKTPTGLKSQVAVYEGNVLRLQKVSRADMGPYFCIASNGVPPSISKRIVLSVHFHPVIHVPNQLVGAPINTDVKLECNVEAYPRSIHFWTKDNGGMVINGERYKVVETTKSMFEVKMLLTIRNFQPSDSGKFSCIAKNSIGDVESVIKLHEIRAPGEESSFSIRKSGDSSSPCNALNYEESEDDCGDELENRRAFEPRHHSSVTTSSTEKNYTKNPHGHRATNDPNKKIVHTNKTPKKSQSGNNNSFRTLVIPATKNQHDSNDSRNINHSSKFQFSLLVFIFSVLI